MIRLTDKKIEEIYNLIAEYHSKYLEELDITMPKLKSGKNYTKDALVLVYLAQGYPNTKKVTKQELTEFIRLFDSKVSDVQQARHLGAQKGWFILSGTRKDYASESIARGEYKLKTLEKAYPGFNAARREEVIDSEYWESLKEKYGYRCACCGSKEGKPHRYWKNTVTELQKGHMDPNKPLEQGNIIPQCEKCNRPDRNYWIYDRKGRVVKIANAKVIDNCSKHVQKEMYIRLYHLFSGKSPEEL